MMMEDGMQDARRGESLSVNLDKGQAKEASQIKLAGINKRDREQRMDGTSGEIGNTIINLHGNLVTPPKKPYQSQGGKEGSSKDSNFFFFFINFIYYPAAPHRETIGSHSVCDCGLTTI